MVGRVTQYVNPALKRQGAQTAEIALYVPVMDGTVRKMKKIRIPVMGIEGNRSDGAPSQKTLHRLVCHREHSQ